jgi:hypothetical protein
VSNGVKTVRQILAENLDKLQIRYLECESELLQARRRIAQLEGQLAVAQAT